MSRSLLNFLLERLRHALLVLGLLSVIAFAVQHQLGDPLRALVGQAVSEAEREAQREKMGLNDPLPQQYFRFLATLPQGGPISYTYKKPALAVLWPKFQATAELVLVAALIVVLISIPAGMFCAVHPRHLFARWIMGASLLSISIPVFLTAILLIYLFSIEWNLLPSFGRGADLVRILGWESGLLSLDGWRHLILPATALSSIMLPLFIRLTRAEMTDALAQDYMRTARAKGLPPPRQYFVHALRNTLLPLLSVGGVQLGTMLAYTLLTESVFQWPGMGFTFLDAVERADTPLITSFLLLVGLIFVVVNSGVDLLYRLADPRVRSTDA